MAPPDLDSVPASPRNGTITPTRTSSQNAHPTASASQTSRPTSRRTSQIFPMNPPPLPLASLGGTIPPSVQSGHQPFPPLSPVTTSYSESGHGLPIRHPRPMTPAELHMELEKEQEAVVNRLTRELNALRAHSSSVASTTSSTSTQPSANTHLLDPSDPSSLPAPTQPTASRRHRSSSTTSTGIPFSVTTAGLPHYHRPPSLAAQGTGASPIDVIASTPSAASRTPSMSHPHTQTLTAVPTTSRYEEVMLHKQELEEAKKENEKLRMRVRELEAMVRGRRESSASRSMSTGTQSRDRSVSVRGGRAAESGQSEGA